MIDSSSNFRACRFVPGAVVALAAICCFGDRSALAGDESWMYRRSYFSHVLPPEVQARYPVPESRSAYRRPMVTVYPGFSVRSVERYNPVQIFDGRSTDTTIYRQFWIEFQP
jgi:hypothetical protein